MPARLTWPRAAKVCRDVAASTAGSDDSDRTWNSDRVENAKPGFCKKHMNEIEFPETGVLQTTTGLLQQTSRRGPEMHDETGVLFCASETGVLQSLCAETGVLQKPIPETGVLQKPSLKPGFCNGQGVKPGFCNAHV